MHCPNCGANLPDDALFCGMCGKRLDEDDPALFSRSSVIGGPPTGLTGPLPNLTEEELAALLRGEGEKTVIGGGREPAGGSPEDGESFDLGESAEVGRGEEFGRKGVSFEDIYTANYDTGPLPDLAPETEPSPADGPGGQEAPEIGDAETNPASEFPFVPETEQPEPDVPAAGAGASQRGADNGPVYAEPYAAFDGNGAPPSGNGGWKRTLLISFLAVAATVALVLWTIRTLNGGGGKANNDFPVTPTMAESRGTESDVSGKESVSPDVPRTESGASDASRAESVTPGASDAESGRSDVSKAESEVKSGESKTDSTDESHSGRRRVTATPTPTLLPTLSPTPRPTATPTPVPKTDADFIRQALGNKNAVLLYVSDAGSAWHTELTIRNDATFTGSYQESVVEIAGDHEMIVRNCTFTGHVYDCRKLKNGTYSMKIKVRMNGSEGESHLEGKKRYVTTRQRGLNSDDEIILYPPGTSTEGLPEGLLGWLRRARGSEITSAQLPCYCVLDMNTGYGFGEYQ